MLGSAAALPSSFVRGISGIHDSSGAFGISQSLTCPGWLARIDLEQFSAA
jgi:hypothetical protein